MDIRERWDDPEEARRAGDDGLASRIWTMMPAKLVSYDAAKGTGSFQVVSKQSVRQPDGSTKLVDIPVLQDVPIHFPGGGGATLTFPLKPGDEAMIQFASRSLDTWHQNGSAQTQPPNDARTHDLSDGIAQVGLRSKPRALKNVSGDAVTLRSDDGKHSFALDPAKGPTMSADEGKHTVSLSSTGLDIKSTGKVSMKADGGYDVEGNMRVKGGVTASGGVSQGAVSFVAGLLGATVALLAYHLTVASPGYLGPQYASAILRSAR